MRMTKIAVATACLTAFGVSGSVAYNQIDAVSGFFIPGEQAAAVQPETLAPTITNPEFVSAFIGESTVNIAPAPLGPRMPTDERTVALDAALSNIASDALMSQQAPAPQAQGTEQYDLAQVIRETPTGQYGRDSSSSVVDSGQVLPLFPLGQAARPLPTKKALPAASKRIKLQNANPWAVGVFR